MKLKNKYSYLINHFPEILNGLDVLIQKAIASLRFDSILLSENEIQLLEKAKSLCEIKIIELFEQSDTEEFKALCSNYFDITSFLLFKKDTEKENMEYFAFEIIKFISIAYLGEEWHKLKRFFSEYSIFDENIADKVDKWNEKVLYTLIYISVLLVKKRSWKDVDKIISQINQLRKLQKEYEENYLKNIQDDERPFAAGELFSLYNFAKSIEILSQYIIYGKPVDVIEQINFYLNYAKEYAIKSGNRVLELLLVFFDAFARKMIRNTIWYVTSAVNHWVTDFNKMLAENAENGIFEFLYPQREAIINGELLNLTKKAVLVNLPTSSGKTLIAEYRILIALNQFKENGGWVAYIVPTRALINQTYKELKNHFSKIGIYVERLSGALELDAFEEELLERDKQSPQFDVLVTTYEKLNLIIRQGYGKNPERLLVLTVVDEAHNIEDKERGLTLELLLATIKNECQESSFLLLTPEIPNSDEIVRWLADDRGKAISLSLNWWQPNERIIGALFPKGNGRYYNFSLKTLSTLKGSIFVGDEFEIIESFKYEKPISSLSKRDIAAFAASKIYDTEDSIIILADGPDETFKIADALMNLITISIDNDPELDLLVRFIKVELGEEHPLVNYLKKGVAIHSSALPDDIRILIEEYVREGKIKIIIATTTIAQGINFPVSLVIMKSYHYRGSGEIPARDFWNIVGRVGRVGQAKPGWVGIVSEGSENELLKIGNYVLKNIDTLQSQLIDLIDKTLSNQDIDISSLLFHDSRWSAILQYISHIYKEMGDLESLLIHLEQKLNSSLGFRQLTKDKKKVFINKVREYIHSEQLEPNFVALSDQTGFSTVTIRRLMGKLSELNITSTDWDKHQLFSVQNRTLQQFIGFMFDTYEIKKFMDELRNDKSFDNTTISKIIIEWVNGKNISELARKFYPNDNLQTAIQKTTKAIYKIISNAVVWGLSAIQRMPNSGIDFEKLSDKEKRRILNIPSYIYYGVNTDEAVLMRKHNVPRSIAHKLGELYLDAFNELNDKYVEEWLKNDKNWQQVSTNELKGTEYKKIWEKLNL